MAKSKTKVADKVKALAVKILNYPEVRRRVDLGTVRAEYAARLAFHFAQDYYQQHEAATKDAREKKKKLPIPAEEDDAFQDCYVAGVSRKMNAGNRVTPGAVFAQTCEQHRKTVGVLDAMKKELEVAIGEIEDGSIPVVSGQTNPVPASKPQQPATTTATAPNAEIKTGEGDGEPGPGGEPVVGTAEVTKLSGSEFEDVPVTELGLDKAVSDALVAAGVRKVLDVLTIQSRQAMSTVIPALTAEQEAAVVAAVKAIAADDVVAQYAFLQG